MKTEYSFNKVDKLINAQLDDVLLTFFLYLKVGQELIRWFFRMGWGYPLAFSPPCCGFVGSPIGMVEEQLGLSLIELWV